MALILGKGPITLLRLVMKAPSNWVYPQDWYYDEEFANTPLDLASPAITAVKLVYEYMAYGRSSVDRFALTYYWTDDKDDAGNRVYVGGWDLGRHKGIQIHRHLANPKVSIWRK